jgi:hypothetical protein
VAEDRNVWLQRLLDAAERISEDLRARGDPDQEFMLARLSDLRARLEAELRGADEEPTSS